MDAPNFAHTFVAKLKFFGQTAGQMERLKFWYLYGYSFVFPIILNAT